MAKARLGKRVLGDPGRLEQLLGICEALPELAVAVAGEQHLTLGVRGKTFAWYLDDHHGDGIVAVCAKSTLERQAELVGRHPDRYYVPAYVGVNGWVGLRLDRPEVDWDEVADLVFAAYRLQAPRRLAREVE